jgi:hypothetical protein
VDELVDELAVTLFALLAVTSAALIASTTLFAFCHFSNPSEAYASILKFC